MEKFLTLAPEKQNTILNSAMNLFGAVGYRKASVSDIAVASGISKSMVFYYFGSKKKLYLYLIEFSGNTIRREIHSGLDRSVTDFFDKIRLITEIKISAMKKFPGILSFLTAMYYETDKEVAHEIKETITEGESYASAFAVDGTDIYKFKDNIDPELVLEILTNYAEGYMSKLSAQNTESMDLLLKQFYKCLTLMKNNFYKEEYL